MAVTLLTLREVQRRTGISRPSLIKYSHEPEAERHAVYDGETRLWRASFVNHCLQRRKVGLAQRGKRKQHK